jgi:hypothetical protein
VALAKRNRDKKVPCALVFEIQQRAAHGIAFFAEPASPARLIFIAIIAADIIGLNLRSGREKFRAQRAESSGQKFPEKVPTSHPVCKMFSTWKSDLN